MARPESQTKSVRWKPLSAGGVARPKKESSHDPSNEEGAERQLLD